MNWYCLLVIALLLISACVVPPDMEEELQNDANLYSAIEQCFYLCKPGYKEEVIFNLDMLCRSYPDFDASNDILGWAYYFDGTPSIAKRFWTMTNDYLLDIKAGKLFLAADSLNSEEVISLGQQVLSEDANWFLGKEVFQKYCPHFGFNEYISVNHMDIRVLMAEAYYVEGELIESLNMLKTINSSLNIDESDPNLAHLLLDLISEYTKKYVLSFF
jgi:hypothetical protein